jgi:TonB-linked SusC/RagA family outer membrane protein
LGKTNLVKKYILQKTLIMKYNLNYIGKAFAFVFLLLGIQSAIAQTSTINGTVNDENGVPLPGVNIIEKNTTNGVATNFDGQYSINTSSSDATLVFSFIGYKTQEVATNGRISINVSMVVDENQLDPVVVIGYGTQKKSSITGAVAIVDVEETEKSQYTNVVDRLQGRVAGVSVTTSGEPGSIGDITIRGSSFFNDNNPLYVVDGVVLNSVPRINPSDVESMQVLKDASSSSIYGSRAANGVILITTKKGEKGKLSFSFNASTGFQQLENKVDVMNSQQWARIAKATFETDPNAAGQVPNYAINVPDIDTDWQDEVIQTGMIRDISANVSAGGEKYNVLFGLNNSYQDGAIRGQQWDRNGIRINTSFEVLKGLTIGQNLSLNRERDADIPSFFGASVVSSTPGILPVIPVLDPTKISGYGHGDNVNTLSFDVNPVGVSALFSDTTTSEIIIGNIYLDYEILDGLKFHFSYGIENITSNGKAINKRGQLRRQWVFNSAMLLTDGKIENSYLESRLTYEKTIGKNTFSIMAAFNDQEVKGQSKSIDYPETLAAFEDGLFEIQAAEAGATPILNSNKYTRVIRSGLARLNYNFDSRYFFKTTVRQDSYSGFVDDKRTEIFPSFDLAWNISNESFFNVDFISNLKIRGSYGEVGNNEASNNPYITSNYIIKQANGANYNFGPSSTPVTGATRDNLLGNPQLGWARMKEYNIGMDVTLFDGKLNLDANYFFGDIENILAEIAVPGTVGASEPSDITVNAVDNNRQGWDASLTFNNFENEFKYSVSANVFANKTEVTSIPPGFTGIVSSSFTGVGMPRAQLFMLDYQGLYGAEDIASLPAGYTIFGIDPLEGDAKFVDINNDDKIDNDDRTIVGDALPDFEFGLNLTASYKNWDFTAFFSGLAGRDVYNDPRRQLISSWSHNYPADYNPWINGVGTDPRPRTSEDHGNYQASTLYMEEASFVKLRTLQFGYTLPPLKGINNARFYLTGQNLFTLTNYSGREPEFTGGFFTSGEDPGGYPPLRTIAIGINLSI